MVKRENQERQARFDDSSKRHLTDFGRIVALFIKVYGFEAFQSGDVNWHWFWFLQSHIPAIEAYSQVQMAQAVVLGGGIIMNGKEVLPLMNKTIDVIYE